MDPRSNLRLGQTLPGWLAALRGVLDAPPGGERHLALSALLLPVLVVVDVLWGAHAWAWWLEFTLAGALLLLHRQVLGRGMLDLQRRRPRWETFFSLGITAMFGYSFLTCTLATLGRLAAGHRLGGAGGPQLYFTAAGAILLGVSLGRCFLRRGEEVLQRRLDSLREGGQGGAASSSRVSPGREGCPGETCRLARRLDGALVLIIVVLSAAIVVGIAWVPRTLDASTAGLLLGLLIFGVPGVFELAAGAGRAVGAFRVARAGGRFRADHLLDRLAGVNHVAIRKFRVLTTGCPQVSEVLPVKVGVSPEEILYMATALEYRMEHPIREAILLRSSESGRTIPQISEHQFVVGRGIRALFLGQSVILGNLRYLSEVGIPCEAVRSRVEELAREGKTVLILASGDEILGLLAMSDEVRDECREAMDLLRQLGIRTSLFSGDHRLAVDALATGLGFDEIHAELTREDTLARLADLRSRGARLAMVSDGAQDMPTLSRLEVGVVFGADRPDRPGGRELHLDGQDLRRVPLLVRVARTVRRGVLAFLGSLLFYHLLILSLVILPFTGLPLLEGAVLAGPARAGWLAAFGVSAGLLPAAIAWFLSLRLSSWADRERARNEGQGEL